MLWLILVLMQMPTSPTPTHQGSLKCDLGCFTKWCSARSTTANEMAACTAFQPCPDECFRPKR